MLFGPLSARGPATASVEQVDESGAPGAYSDVTAKDQWENFLIGVPEGTAPRISSDDFAAWAAAYMATDPGAGTRSPSSVRVPGGPDADWVGSKQGALDYDPARVLAPTLIIRGEWDAVSTDADAQWLCSGSCRPPFDGTWC